MIGDDSDDLHPYDKVLWEGVVYGVRSRIVTKGERPLEFGNVWVEVRDEAYSRWDVPLDMPDGEEFFTAVYANAWLEQRK